MCVCVCVHSCMSWGGTVILMVQSKPVTDCWVWHPWSSCSFVFASTSAAIDWSRDPMRIGSSLGSSGSEPGGVTVRYSPVDGWTASKENFTLEKQNLIFFPLSFIVHNIKQVPIPEFPAASFAWRAAVIQHPPLVVTYSAGSVLQSGATPRSVMGSMSLKCWQYQIIPVLIKFELTLNILPLTVFKQ